MSHFILSQFIRISKNLRCRANKRKAVPEYTVPFYKLLVYSLLVYQSEKNEKIKTFSFFHKNGKTVPKWTKLRQEVLKLSNFFVFNQVLLFRSKVNRNSQVIGKTILMTYDK